MRSSRAWVNIYLNNNTNNPSDHADLLNITALSGKELDLMIHSNNSLVKSFFHTNLFKPIYDHYSPMGFCGTTYELCTLKELTYQQWINQLVLLNPPPSMNMTGTNESYVRAFPSWTVLSFTPELGYYLGKAELPQFSVNVSDVLSFMQPNRLFN